MEKVSRLFEERILKEAEEFDFNQYINNLDLNDYDKKDLFQFVEIYRNGGHSDSMIKYYLEREIEDIIKRNAKREEEKNKESEWENKKQSIINSTTLLGKKLADFTYEGVYFEDGSRIYIDEFGQGNTIIYEDDNGGYISQTAGSQRDWEFTKSMEEKYPNEYVIFPSKSEAQLFIQLIKFAGESYGNMKLKVKAQYIYTPDIQSYSLNLDENSFDYLKGTKLSLSTGYREEDNKPYVLDDISLHKNDYDNINCQVSLYAVPENNDSIFDDIYTVDYNIALGKLRKTKKEDIKYSLRSYQTKIDKNYIRGFEAIIDEIRKVILKNYK